MGTRRAAVYLRCSTDRGHTDNQAPAVMQLARARGFEIAHVFDENVSAVKQRPEWTKLREAAHRGEFEAVVVFALDRLGRSMVGNLQEVLTLDRLGVAVVSVREPWLDMAGPVRELLIGISRGSPKRNDGRSLPDVEPAGNEPVVRVSTSAVLVLTSMSVKPSSFEPEDSRSGTRPRSSECRRPSSTEPSEAVYRKSPSDRVGASWRTLGDLEGRGWTARVCRKVKVVGRVTARRRCHCSRLPSVKSGIQLL